MQVRQLMHKIFSYLKHEGDTTMPIQNAAKLQERTAEPWNVNTGTKQIIICILPMLTLLTLLWQEKTQTITPLLLVIISISTPHSFFCVGHFTNILKEQIAWNEDSCNILAQTTGRHLQGHMVSQPRNQAQYCHSHENLKPPSIHAIKGENKQHHSKLDKKTDVRIANKVMKEFTKDETSNRTRLKSLASASCWAYYLYEIKDVDNQSECCQPF